MARSLSQKTLIIAAGTGIQSVLTQVALNLFLVRLMDSQETFGIYRQVWLVVNTAAPVFMFGLDASVFYYFPNLVRGLRRGFLGRTMGLLFVSGSLLALLLTLGSRSIAALFSAPEVEPLLRSLAMYVAFGIPSTLLFQFLIADDRAVRAVLYNILILVAQTALTVIMVARGDPLTSLFHALGVFSLVRCLHAMFEIARYTDGSWLAKPAFGVKEHLGYALPVGVTATVAMLGGRLDKFVVASFLDPASYGVYSVGAMEFPLVPLLGSAVATVLRMRVAVLHHAGNIPEIVNLYGNAFRKIGLVLVPMGLCLGLFAPELMTVLYTGAYVETASVFRIYLLLILVRLAPLEPMLASLGMTQVLLLGGVGFLGVDLALNLLSVRWLGILGPPSATVAATASLAVFYAVHAARRLGLPFRALYPARVVLRILAVCLLAAAAALPAKLLPSPPAVVLGVGSGIYALVFTGLGFASRTLGREDLRVFGGLEGWILDARRRFGPR